MSYYMGDYYPRGDPGFGSFFRRIGRGIGGFLTGGPLGAVQGLIMPGGAKTAAAGGLKAAMQRAGGTIIEVAGRHPVMAAAGALTAASGAALVGMGAGAMAERAMVPGATYAPGHKGRVLKHCGLVLKSGKIGKCHRRMNPFNPRAARRAGRRIHSLIRHYRKYVGFVSARKPKGRPYFKARRRK